MRERYTIIDRFFPFSILPVPTGVGPEGRDKLRPTQVEAHLVDEPAIHHEDPRPPRLGLRLQSDRQQGLCRRRRGTSQLGKPTATGQVGQN